MNALWGADWPEVRASWPLDPDVAHLNNGGYGAAPVPVVQAQERWRQAMEANPNRFLGRDLPEALDRARRVAAEFLRADDEGFVFVANATTAVNTVLASVGLGEGDEVLLTDHGYGACQLAARRWCGSVGARVVVQPVPLPMEGPDELEDAVLAGVTDRTRLAIVDHVASPTGLVFPVRRLVQELRVRGVRSLVDGAHAVGMLEVDLGDLNADFWTGNFHKGCCAPRGAAGLWVGPEFRDRITPLVTSWHVHDGFTQAFGWLGTNDYTAYLCVPDGLSFMEGLGWQRVRRHNRELASLGARLVGEALETEPPVPLDADAVLFEALTLVALPGEAGATVESARELVARAARDLRAELAVTTWSGRGFLRLSAQAYNAPFEYERLAEGLPRLLEP